MRMTRRQPGLGFLSPGFEVIEGGDAYDVFWGYGFDAWSWDFGGGDWWSNFNAEGDYVGTGGASGYNWWDNFDPITGDYIGSGDTIFVGQTDAPAPLPTTGGNWWDFLTPWFYTPPPTPSNPYGLDPPPAAPGQQLPGYCPQGTYHPISDPFSCVPFPEDGSQGNQQRKPPANQPRSSGQAAKPQQQRCPSGQIYHEQLKRCIPICPRGQVFDARQNKCITPPSCPQGTAWSPAAGQCVKTSTAAAGSGFPWWVWALIAGVGVKVLSDSGGSDTGRRRRR